MSGSASGRPTRKDAGPKAPSVLGGEAEDAVWRDASALRRRHVFFSTLLGSDRGANHFAADIATRLDDASRNQHSYRMNTEPVERRVDAGSLSLNYLDYGNADAPPLTMWHGQADSAWALDSVAQALAANNHVLSFDLRGHGRSDWGAYTLMHLVGDIMGAIEALELDQPVVLGHSLGGQAVAQFGGLYPDVPAALVLIESLGPPPHKLDAVDPDGAEHAWARMVADVVRQPARHRTFENLDAAVERYRKVHPLLDPDRARFIVERTTLVGADDEVEWRFDPATRDWLAGHDHGRAEQRWRAITCPTQIILGAEAWERFWNANRAISNDRLGPMSAEETERRLTNFSGAAKIDFTEIPDAGHMIHYEQPTALNTEIQRFLATL